MYAFTLILVSIYGNKPTNSNVAQQGVGFSSIIKVNLIKSFDFVVITMGTFPPSIAR